MFEYQTFLNIKYFIEKYGSKEQASDETLLNVAVTRHRVGVGKARPLRYSRKRLFSIGTVFSTLIAASKRTSFYNIVPEGCDGEKKKKKRGEKRGKKGTL